MTIGADDAMNRLMDGNDRFVNGGMVHPNTTPGRRADLKEGQAPFAAILTCSDSRVPPEHIFDQGLGDIFVIRTAGNVVDDVALGSIEYAVAHLHCPLVLVLGHTGCGAVKATLAGGEPEGHIAAIVNLIRPAVQTAEEHEGDRTLNTIKENVRSTVERIGLAEPVIRSSVGSGRTRIVGAIYDLGSGKVGILGPPSLT